MCVCGRLVFTHARAIGGELQDGHTPLHLAALHGLTDMVKELVRAKADLEARDTVRRCVMQRGLDSAEGGRCLGGDYAIAMCAVSHRTIIHIIMHMRCVRECRELLGAQCERFAALRYSPALSPNAVR